MRDERQQRPGADQRDATADGHALRLEGDLGAAEREHAGQRPAREGERPIHRPGRQDQPVEALLAVAIRPEEIELALEDVPDERLRPVVDPVGEVRQHAVDRGGLRRLEPVQLGRGASCAPRRLAVDLASRPLALVEQDRPHAAAGKRLGGAHASRPGADDRDDRLSHGSRPR